MSLTPSRREFLEGAAAATAAGLLLPGCEPGGGSGAHPPVNATPIPEFQLLRMPEDGYEDRRVVRVHDRRVSRYGFGEDDNAAMSVDAEVLREMLEAALVVLARAESIGEAWRALLPGELGAARVAIKVNLNGDLPTFVNTSPAMVVALARSLEAAGVDREAMTFFDRSRGFHEVYRRAIEAEVPGVVLLGADEVAVDGAEVVSAPSMVLADGSAVAVPAPRCLVEADHLINVHLMKGHFGGSTGAMKNLFGLARNVWETFHGRDDLGLRTYGVGAQCADLATQPLVRDKSRLLLSEAVYGTWWHANKPPDRFRNEGLFPGGIPCSLVAGRNPLHHDMVLFDLLREERDHAPLDEGYAFYPDDWLQTCAREPYLVGVFEHGAAVEGTFTPTDLGYRYLDYRSLTTAS